MAKVPLRTYNHEIERLIDQGQFEEAIAHCRYILESFPKYLETYRILGNAYLESQRYGEAADIFLRVISSIPDDFVSNIGMSIVREDEGNLEAAIWHMERAYEAQPANSAIQDELRRLIGRRDKVEPSRVRLTRGALIRMYVRGDLYNQAIAEARIALSEEPQRADIQILLAKMCYLAGQRVEATDLCSSLLAKYQYCLEANQILADILPELKRAQDAQIYRLRINALEPYSAYVSRDFPTPLDVPETAVMLEELVWHPAPPAAEQPQWAATLGINVFDQPGASEKVPEWFNESAISSESGKPPDEFKVEASTETEISEPGIQDTISQLDQTVLPDWMKNAGFVVTDGTNEEPSTINPETLPENIEEPAVDIEKAELPDWLQAIAPQTQTEAESSDDIKSFENLFSPPIVSPGLSTAEEIPPVIGEIQPQSTEESIPSESTTPKPIDVQPQQPIIEEQESPLAWLEGLEAKHEEKGEVSLGELGVLSGIPAAWIDESVPENNTVIEQQKVEHESPTAKPETYIETPPTWIQEFSDQAVETEAEKPIVVEAAQTSSELNSQPTPAISSENQAGISPADQDSAFAWLESLAAKQGADEETLLVNPEERNESLPDWIQNAVAQSGAAPTSPLQETTPPTMNEEPSISTAENALGAEVTPYPTPEEESSSIINNLEAPEATSLPLIAVSPEPPAITSVPSQENLVDAMAWLESLASKQGANEEELFIKPEERKDKPPEWIVESTSESPLKTVVSPQQETISNAGSEDGFNGKQALEISQDQPSSELIVPVPSPEESSVRTNDVVAAPETQEAKTEKEELIPAQSIPTAPQVENAAVPPSEAVPEWIQNLESAPTEVQPSETITTAKEKETPETSNEETEWLQTLQSPEEELSLTKPIPESEATDFTWFRDLEQNNHIPFAEETQRIVVSGDQVKSNESELIPLAETYLTPAPLIPSLGVEQNKKLLKEAQFNLAGDKIDLALKGYYALVESNQFLDETIHDLRDALYKYPVEISIWQALGDAYVRSNRLQDALDAYTQAENLIR